MNRKTLPIKKVTGYMLKENRDHLKISWQTTKPTWEPETNVMCFEAIEDFENSIKDWILSTETKLDNEDKKNEEMKIFEKLRNMNKPILTGKEKPFENTQKISEPKYGNLPKFNKEDVKKNEVFKKFDGRFNSNNIIASGRTQDQNLKPQYSNDPKRDNRSNEYKPHHEFVPSASFVKNMSFVKRYFHKNEEVVEEKKVKITKTDKSTNIFIKGVHYVTLTNILNVLNDSRLTLDKINIDYTIKTSHLTTLLFTIRQNPFLGNISVYRGKNEDKDMDDRFYDLLNKMKVHHFVLVDDTNPQKLYIFTPGNKIFKEYLYDYEFLIFELPKTLLSKKTKYDDIFCKTLQNQQFEWIMESQKYNFCMESYLQFQMEESRIRNFSSYTILGDYGNVAVKELKEFLSIMSCSEKIEENFIVETVFIHKPMKDKIHKIPNLLRMLTNKTKFYYFEMANNQFFYNVNIIEIFPKGGIITMTEKILTANANIKDFLAVIECLQKNTDWVCKIPTRLYDNYKNEITKFKNTIAYKEHERMLTWLETCIEDFKIADMTEYLNCLMSKYFKIRRHFYIMNHERMDDNVLTPSEIFAYMEK